MPRKNKPKVRKNKNTKKGQSKRSRTKYPDLNPSVNIKMRKEEIEDMASYLDQLNEKEKAWLNQFAKEYVNANLKNAKFHKSKKMKKDCYDRNNARNRCVLTRAKAAGQMIDYDLTAYNKKLQEEEQIEDELLFESSDSLENSDD